MCVCARGAESVLDFNPSKNNVNVIIFYILFLVFVCPKYAAPKVLLILENNNEDDNKPA